MAAFQVAPAVTRGDPEWWHLVAVAGGVWAAFLTFVVIPLFTIRWGKIYCSYICSCGALAETVGNGFRHRGPKGDAPRRWEKMGFVFIGLASVATIADLLKINGPFEWYNMYVGTALSGAVAIGLYPFLGQRITHHIGDSVMNFQQDGLEFFDVKEHILAGRTMSLNHIEHELIRKLFEEPRIHVALVCAARSCPAIRAEAYTGPRLDAQLADQSYLFVNDRRYVAVDAATGELLLSPILNWYGKDWKGEGGYLQWILERTADQEVRAALETSLTQEPQIRWNEYDWSLNSQSEPGASIRTQPSAFGSGSVPNE